MRRSPTLVWQCVGIGLLVVGGAAGGAADQFLVQETGAKIHGTTEAKRKEYVAKAHVWDPEQFEAGKALTPEQIKTGPTGPLAVPFNQQVTCRFVEPTLDNLVGGQTPKFLCGGSTPEHPCPECNVTRQAMKVKFSSGRSSNPEIYGEVLGTRLLWVLGFIADGDYPVHVTCVNCPSDPWSVYQGFRGQAAGLDKDKPADVARAAEIARKLGGSRATRSFPFAVVETRFDGAKIKVDGLDCRSAAKEASDPRCGGFGWDEAAQISEAAGGDTRAHVDALKLLAAFMTHMDNKPGNQRFVCPEGSVDVNGGCAQPEAMIQDIGTSFGTTQFFGLKYKKVDLDGWSGEPLWDDLGACRARLKSTHELSNPVVSEAGRKFLAELMDPAVLTDAKVAAIFEAARVVEKGDTHNGHPVTVADWVEAFDRKRADLMRSCGAHP